MYAIIFEVNVSCLSWLHHIILQNHQMLFCLCICLWDHQISDETAEKPIVVYSDEVLAPKTSAFESLYGANLPYQLSWLNQIFVFNSTVSLLTNPFILVVMALDLQSRCPSLKFSSVTTSKMYLNIVKSMLCKLPINWSASYQLGFLKCSCLVS